MSSDIDAQFDAAFADLPDDPDHAGSEAAGDKAASLDYSQYTDTPEATAPGSCPLLDARIRGNPHSLMRWWAKRLPLLRTSRKQLVIPSAVWSTARTHKLL